jgi:hypothetical protein
MNLLQSVKQYADQIGGTFTDYDHTKAIVVVPLHSGRFQTVLVVIEKSKTSGKQRAVFTSKVAEYNASIDAYDLLVHNGSFDFSKFIIEDGQLKVVASSLLDTTTDEDVKFMIQEVAQLADHYELKFTGKDIH